jgi:hypothetical protein
MGAGGGPVARREDSRHKLTRTQLIERGNLGGEQQDRNQQGMHGFFSTFSVADLDPGSGAFLTFDPGSGIGFFRISDPNPYF